MHFLNSEYFKKDFTFFWSESQGLVQRELLCFALEYMYGGSFKEWHKNDLKSAFFLTISKWVAGLILHNMMFGL